MTRTFRDVLDELDADAQNTVEKGHSFERLVQAFLEQDRVQSQRFDKVWLWDEWPGRWGADVGIDVIARERDSGGLVAIQCKFYSPSRMIFLNDISTFAAAYWNNNFESGVVVTTTELWGRNVEALLESLDKPFSRWGPDVFEHSSIDWETFDLSRPTDMTPRVTKDLRDYQVEAMQDTLNGFEAHDRGKLIMACGSGKTFTALRIAEKVAGVGGAVLFLTPSLSLLSQSLIDWANDADVPLKTFAVCSDTHVGKRDDDAGGVSPYDLVETPSTDAEHLRRRFLKADRSGYMTTVFSTYQSLEAVAAAQKAEDGLPAFDLIICDEAHRTTGASLVGTTESSFRRIHDDEFIRGRKRLYMTATPRIYGDRAKTKAHQSQVTLASMDDESLYGPEFHRLGFGRAIELGILSEYKVIIFNVDQEQVGIDLNQLLSDSGSDVNMDNAARMVGCWNGLGKRASEGLDFTLDPQPAKRAVAFSNLIKESKLFREYFPPVIESCITAAGEHGENQLRCDVHHVDGTQNALLRARELAWLRQEPEAGECRILSNAHCLTEGVDVPALDAILFLHPRKSEIDVVQAVGRVMRKSEGKRYGYIVLPIAQAPNTTAEESVNKSAYQAVWQVINAISAHDDRFEAQINQLALARETTKPDYLKGAGIGDTSGGDDSTIITEEQAIQGKLMIAGSPELRDAILAKIVDKYTDPLYWEKWADNIREIAERHEARIRALLKGQEKGIRETFDQFLKGVQDNLNDGITEDDAIGMLSQHLVTKPVFDALFADYDFSGHNSVSQAMQATIDTLAEHGLEKETASLEKFYRDVRIRARGVSTAEGKQQIIADLYERFLKLALPKTAESLGIVYTPTAAVDYIIRSVEDVLNREFGVSVSNEGVHILEPFVGTGTFVTRLLQSSSIKPADLKRKYESELHANDIMLLAYYIAAINIESTYHDLAGATEYKPFNGIVLTDTFQLSEPDAPMNQSFFLRNNARIENQRELDIRVIIGNPPWSIGQQSENDDNKNQVYKHLRQRISETYSRRSTATLQRSLYDTYVQAIRWASDRIQERADGGIVAFITNGGFIASGSADGLRKTLASEFHQIYCLNLRGDQRTAGEKSRQEGGKLFGSGSRASVSILILVKKPGKVESANVYYHEAADYQTREEKLAFLENHRLSTTPWRSINPNEYGDWINQRTGGFENLIPLYGQGGVFNLNSLGILTARDAWCYNYSKPKITRNTQATMEFFNQQIPTTEPSRDPTRFSWTRKTLRMAARNIRLEHDANRVVSSAYRPFCRQNAYFQRNANEEVYQQERIYPTASASNIGIAISEKDRSQSLSCLMTDTLPNYSILGTTSQYLPRWVYNPLNLLSSDPSEQYEKVCNINPAALAQFRQHYSDDGISEDDLFYYVYGVLQHQGYLTTYANDLSKSSARIPMAASSADFHAFATAGRELADLHVNYETADLYPLEEIRTGPMWSLSDTENYRVAKMSYAGKRPNLDRSRIVYNEGITLAGVPDAAHEYRLGPRSALDWLIDRYQVKTDKDSGITNDPNDWAAEHGEPRYIIDLVKRITTVSIRTVDIVRALPELPL